MAAIIYDLWALLEQGQQDPNDHGVENEIIEDLARLDTTLIGEFVKRFSSLDPKELKEALAFLKNYRKDNAIYWNPSKSTLQYWVDKVIDRLVLALT